MQDPVTTLDTRFGDSDAVAIGWDETRLALEAAELFWISTVRKDGRPHVAPLVAVWLDEAIHFCTGPDEQKAKNLAHNRHVILMTGCNQWDSGLDVIVEGDADRVMERDRLERLAEGWANKWDGRWRFEAGEGAFQHSDGGQALVFAVVPTKVFVFGKGTFSQTRHQF
jgi:general stress protein 26